MNVYCSELTASGEKKLLDSLEDSGREGRGLCVWACVGLGLQIMYTYK